MKVDGGVGWNLSTVGAQARELEEMGYSGIQTAETAHDPFLPLAFAAQDTETVDLITGIAVAFSRTPMLLAQLGHDLNAAAEGRFVLGPRFPDPPAHHQALQHAVVVAGGAHARVHPWRCARSGRRGTRASRLQFTGKFYTHTLMTPFFTPTNNEHGAPRVFLAAVGPLMTEVAGEVADGIIVHAFTTEKYLRETTLPALERGFAKARAAGVDKSFDNFEVSYPCFVVTGRDGEGDGGGEGGDDAPDRLLRVHAGLQAGTRQHRCRRPAAGAQQHVEAGPVGGDGDADRRIA